MVKELYDSEQVTKILDEIKSEIEEEGRKNNLSPEQIAKNQELIIASYINEDGSYKTGHEFLVAFSAQSLKVFGSCNTMLYDNKKIFSDR